MLGNYFELAKPIYEFIQHLQLGQTAYHQTENLKLAQLIRLTQGLKRYEDGSDWSGRKVVRWWVQDYRKVVLDERYRFRQTRKEDWLNNKNWGSKW